MPLARLVLVTSFVSLTASALEVVNRWVLPSRPESFRIELRPHERTKPVLVGDILYYANLAGKLEAVHRSEGYAFWSTKIPGSVVGSLGYGRSRLYVGDNQGNFLALAARDGSVAWQFKSNSEWQAPAAVSKNLVFAMNSAEELFALSESTGKEVWHYSQRGDEKMTIRGTAGPVVAGDTVFQGFADGSLVALSAADGKVIWSKRLRTKSRFYDVDMNPVVDGDLVYVATFDGKLFALSRSTGETRWIFPAGSYGSFATDEKTLYFAGLNGFVHALAKDSGDVKWKASLEAGVGMTPALVGENVFVTTSADPAYLLSAASGTVLWKKNLGAGAMAGATSSAVDNWFYCFSNYGNLFSFEVLPTVRVVKDGKVLRAPSAIHRGQS